MLNRRHLRIKGFQALYAFQQAEVKEQKIAEKQLLQAVQLVHDAYINLLQLALEIAQFEENAVAEKSNKHMPTAADLNSTAVLLKNKFIAQLAQDVDFQKIAKAYKINWNGEDLNDRLKRIEAMLHIPTRDVTMEEKYKKLKSLWEQYHKALDEYKTWETLKESK